MPAINMSGSRSPDAITSEKSSIGIWSLRPRHHLMACDRPNPGAERCILIPTLPFEVNGEQRFLHNILGILIALSGSSQAAARQAAKDKGQLQQQFPVSMSKAHWFSWLSAPTRCPLVLFGPCGPCVTCPIHPRYQVLVITDMRGRCNGKAREIVREGVETACRVSSWEGGEPQL
jgi:hypothetical protein